MTATNTRAARGAACLVLATGLLLGCGDDDTADNPPDDASTTTTTATTDTTVTSPPGDDDDQDDGDGAAGEVLEVEMIDFAFAGLPASVPAGTRLTVINSSESELHELIAMRIPDDETRSVHELLDLPDEELDALFTGPPAAVLLAAPGGEQINAVGDGTLTEPGRYALLCFIPTGVDPDEFFAAAEEQGEGPPELANAGPPHVVHGMVAELIVE